jgi:flavin reductase (DIM6/NTAB) family NADH-FMN oxidoreductase RutF
VNARHENAAGPAPAGADHPFAQTFREVFRRHASGVAILTVNYGGRPFGFTATSVASLSAEPPRFTFNMARTSSSWPAVANSTYLGVHMLGLENRELADRFARTKDRFSGDHWETGPYGVPLLKNVPAFLVGRIELRLSFENNAVVVVDVVEGSLGSETAPLLYHSGSYVRSQPIEYEI